MNKTYDVNKYDRPSVSVDVLLFSVVDKDLRILLVERGEEPFRGMWSLPGGFVEMKETLEKAAMRELKEESGVDDVYLEQLFTFGDPGRDPRTRVITVTYMALAAKTDWHLKSSGDVSKADFFSVRDLPKLAFDHKKIVEYGLERLRSKLGYSNIAFGLLPDAFSLTDMQSVYEIILGRSLDKRNFRKKILSLDLLKPLGKKSGGGAHRPAELYKFRTRSLVLTD